MDPDQFIMIFDSPERDIRDSRCKTEESVVDEKAKIKTEPDPDPLVVHGSRRQVQTVRPIKVEVEGRESEKLLVHDKGRSTNIHSDLVLSAGLQEPTASYAATKAPDTGATSADCRSEQFTEHDLQRIFPAQSITSSRPPLSQMESYAQSKPVPTSISIPISDIDNTAGLCGGQEASQSSSEISRSTPEAQRLSRLQIQLDQIDRERDAEQARLDEIAADLEEIRTRTRALQRLVEDSQARVRTCKAEVAEAHTEWKQAQARFKDAKDKSLELSDKSSELVKERCEKADRHEVISDRMADIIARRTLLKRRLAVAKELAEISQEFTDQETKDFVRRVRNLPRIRVKIEKDCKDEGSSSDNESATTANSHVAGKLSEGDDAEIIDWRNLAGDNTTFNQINHLRNRLNLVKSESFPDHIEAEHNGQDSESLEPRSSASVEVKSESRESVIPSPACGVSQPVPPKLSLADIRAHVDQIVYHKKQLDKYLNVARGSKRKADDMTGDVDDEDEHNKSETSDSDDGSIMAAARARKRRKTDEPIN